MYPQPFMDRKTTADTRDVIVIGAGIVGCLTGYLLAKQDLKVTILGAELLEVTARRALMHARRLVSAAP